MGGREGEWVSRMVCGLRCLREGVHVCSVLRLSKISQFFDLSVWLSIWKVMYRGHSRKWRYSASTWVPHSEGAQPPLGPYSRPLPIVLRRSWVVDLFLTARYPCGCPRLLGKDYREASQRARPLPPPTRLPAMHPHRGCVCAGEKSCTVVIRNKGHTPPTALGKSHAPRNRVNVGS